MVKILKILILTGFLASCTLTDSSYTAADKELDMSVYKTYAWIPKDSSSIQNVLYDNEIVESEIMNNVNYQLQQRGFVISTDTPDVLLQYTLIVEKKEQTVSTPVIVAPVGPRGYIAPYNSNAYNSTAYDSPWNLYYYSNPGNVYNPGYYANNYPYYSSYGFPSISSSYAGNVVQDFSFKEGTLIIDIIDRKKNQLIWRGWNTEAMPDPNNYKKSLPREIQEIFRKLPTSQDNKK